MTSHSDFFLQRFCRRPASDSVCQLPSGRLETDMALAMNLMDLSDREGLFLYSVLNVSEHASPAEIHDRYRELSLIFHPDKQRNDQLRDVAAKNFLDIQKAYEGY
ncbi:hypothetical protein F5146DRAFT_496559 [Armillaria mellea]|nr:hypothetical protein F5146DRAFT_496559 [Armillaria mellea]